MEIPVEWKMEAASSSHSFHPWLYACVVQAADPNWFCADVALTFFVLGFPLQEDTANGRAATHKLYSFDIDVWFGANAGIPMVQDPAEQCYG